MLCKDTLTYFEVGPNFSASKQTLKTTIAGVTRTLFDNSSTTIGLAFGGGVKVAVSEKVIVSLGYRFTQASTKIERKDLKAGHKAHNFLVGIAYKF
jgi:opacity protein-like surface antigen